MDPLQSGSNPINNPRLDLLHNTGNNQQLNGAAGSYGPDTSASAFHQKPVPEPPVTNAPKPTPAAPPPPPAKPAADYVSAAQSKRPATPVPMPEPPAPEPRPAPTPPPPTEPRSGRPIVIGIAVIVILAAVAAGGWLWWTHRAKPAAQAPATVEVTPQAPTNLTQVDSSNVNIDKGATTKQNKVTFGFNVSTNANSGSLTPEVELEPAGTAFTGQPTVTGQAVTATGSNMQFTVNSDTLKDGAYHWQARVSKDGQHSNWAVFGNDATAAAFTVTTVAPAAPTVSTIGGVNVANPTVVTSNRPAFSGKADPNATITVNVSPDSQKFTTTADSSGTWTVTPNVDIPNGQHQLSITATNAAGVASTATQIALTVNPATAADTTPSPTASSAAPSASSTPAASAATAPAPSKNLAATGDNTTAVSLISLTLMVMAAGGILLMRRRYAES